MVFALLLVRSLSVLHEDHFSAPIDMKRAHFHSKSLYKPHRKRKPRSAIGLFKLLASNRGSQFLFQPFGTFDLLAIQVCNHFSAPIDMKRAHFHSKSLYISRAVSNFHRTKFDIWAGFESVDSTAPLTAEIFENLNTYKF